MGCIVLNAATASYPLVVVTGTPFSGLTRFAKLLKKSHGHRLWRDDLWIERVVPTVFSSNCSPATSASSTIDHEYLHNDESVLQNSEIDIQGGYGWHEEGSARWQDSLLARVNESGRQPSHVIYVSEGQIEHVDELLLSTDMQIVIMLSEPEFILQSFMRRGVIFDDASVIDASSCFQKFQRWQVKFKQMSEMFPERVKAFNVFGWDSALNMEENFYTMLDWLGILGPFQYHVTLDGSEETDNILT